MPRADSKQRWRIDHDPAYREHVRIATRNARVRAHNRNLTFVAEYLIAHPCVDCGERDIRFLDFDHIVPKKTKVSQLVLNAVTTERLAKEMAKCQVRCLKCHRKKHCKHSLTWKIKARVMRAHGVPFV